MERVTMAKTELKINYDLVSPIEDERHAAAQFMEGLIAASLCANCKHQAECVYLKKACSPILECELHECGLSAKPRLTAVKKQPRPNAQEEYCEDEILGLCVNCDNLKGCNLPKHPGGVWYCEEYC
jgi:hypothetical protein